MLDDLQTASISLPPEYITTHQKDFKRKLSDHLAIIKSEYENLRADNKFIDYFNFDKTGEARIPINSLNDFDKKLMSEIESKCSYETFFKKEKNLIRNRQQIYYSVRKDEDRIYQAFKTFVFLDTNLLILFELEQKEFKPGSFVLASILDDVRYKLILLYEDVLVNKIEVDVSRLEKIVEEGIWIFYSYLLGRPQTIIGYSQLINFVSEARDFLAKEYLNKFGDSKEKLRTFKEGDIPSDNLLFIDKLKRSIPKENIDCIIGIPFGGIEIPYLVKRFIYPNAKVKLIRVSNYSKQSINECENADASEFRSKNILIVDDGITTGRSVARVIEFLKNGNCKNIYLACIYISGPKRFKHMQRKDHGSFNFVDQLKKCCVLNETNYTASGNKIAYTNRRGVFDKAKVKVEAKADQGKTLFDFKNENENKDDNTRKVFIACSLSYISEHYDRLKVIRDAFFNHPHYEIVDDWISNRIELKSGKPLYKEVEGRHVPLEAIRDIGRSDKIILFCPGPSTYVSLLFLTAANLSKEIWIYYARKEHTKGFDFYKKARLIPLTKLRDSLHEPF
jgi:hypoxanthine phosphoribosyltransferase